MSLKSSIATGTSPSKVFILGNYAYVVNSLSNTFNIYDISNKSTPILKSSTNVVPLPNGSILTDIFVLGNIAFICNSDSGNFTVMLFDITNKINPTLLNQLSYDFKCYGIFVVNNLFYLTNRKNSTLQINDFTNPLLLNTLSTTAIGLSDDAIYVSGNYAYITSSDPASQEFYIVDISNPNAPAFVSVTATMTPYNIFVLGNYAYIANGISGTFQIYDISNPANPVIVNTIITGFTVHGIFVDGIYAYVTNNDGANYQVFDISNPLLPLSVSTDATDVGPESIFISGNYAYVVNNASNTLQIFDSYPPPIPPIPLPPEITLYNHGTSGLTNFSTPVSILGVF